MIYPAIANRCHHRNRILIMLFAGQGCIQPFISYFNPYLAFTIIFITGIYFTAYCWYSRSSKHWEYLTYVSAAIVGINIVMLPLYHFMHIDLLPAGQYIISDDRATTVIILLTAVQVYLIYRITANGRWQHFRNYINDFGARFIADLHSAKHLLCNVGKKQKTKKWQKK